MELIDQHRAGMQSPSSVVQFRNTVRLQSDYSVRVQSSDYKVGPNQDGRPMNIDH